jgi:ribosome biogenesis GTPase A
LKIYSENLNTWAKSFRQDVPTLTFSTKLGQIDVLVKELLDLVKSMAPNSKRSLIAFAGYPNTGKSTILKLITECVKNNLAKCASLPNFREVSK